MDRLRRTAYYVAAGVFGDDDPGRTRPARSSSRCTRKVRGIDPVTGKPYSADDPDTQVWVHCVEWHSFLAAYRVFGPGADARGGGPVLRRGRPDRRADRHAAGDGPAVGGRDARVLREGAPASCACRPRRARRIDFVSSPPMTREYLPVQVPLRVYANAALALVPRDLRQMAGIDRPRAADAAAHRGGAAVARGDPDAARAQVRRQRRRLRRCATCTSRPRPSSARWTATGCASAARRYSGVESSAMTDEQRVLIDVADHVATVTLNRPDKHNALDGAMFEAIPAAADEVGEHARRPRRRPARRRARASAPASTSPRSRAGRSRSTTSSQRNGHRANIAQRVATDWIDVPVPVIAAIHGNCFGGGLQIALGADIRFAAPDAKLSVMECKWGLVPDMGITSTLPRLVPIDVAKELTFTARILSGEEAKELGLVTHVADDPLAAAQELAARDRAALARRRARREEALRRGVGRTGRGGAQARDRPPGEADRLAEPDRRRDRRDDEAAGGVRRSLVEPDAGVINTGRSAKIVLS